MGRKLLARANSWMGSGLVAPQESEIGDKSNDMFIKEETLIVKGQALCPSIGEHKQLDLLF